MGKEQEAKEQEAKERTLEESFAELDGVLERLESREITLEESFRAYQQGMELLKQCNQKIDRVEKKMQIIDEEGGFRDF